MIRRPPRSTPLYSSAASDVYKRQIYWSHIDIVYYGNSRENAAEIEFDDKFIYDEIKKDIDERKIPLKQILKDEAIKAFNLWAQTENKTKY